MSAALTDHLMERKRGVKVLASISRDNVIVDETVLRKAYQLENIGLKALDALHAPRSLRKSCSRPMMRL